MDISSKLDGLTFIWDAAKAASNFAKHSVSFETAREIFLDALSKYEDAGGHDEMRHALIGTTLQGELLVVVHVELDWESIRIISARLADSRERNYYEND